MALLFYILVFVLVLIALYVFIDYTKNIIESNLDAKEKLLSVFLVVIYLKCTYDKVLYFLL